MSLRLDHHDEKHIVLKRQPYGCVNSLPTVVGMVLLVIPCYFLLGAVSNYMQFGSGISPMGAVVLLAMFGFGGLFVIAGTVLLPALHKSIPEQMVFDHEAAVIRVTMKGKKDEGIIPYQEISGYRIHTESDVDENSSSKVTHYLVIVKKDGGEWFLNSGREASRILDLLKAVPLDRQATTETEVKMPAKLTVHETESRSLITWRNRFSAPFIFVVIFALIFVTATLQGAREVGYMMVPFGIASMGLLFLVYKFVRFHTARFAVCITNEQFEYYEFSAVGGKKRTSKAWPLEDIRRITYIFSPHVKGSTRFWIMTSKDVAYMETYAGDPEKRLMDSVRNLNQPLILQLNALDPVECLHLERWLEHRIRQRKPQSSVI
jgi:hypothetical protein